MGQDTPLKSEKKPISPAQRLVPCLSYPVVLSIYLATSLVAATYATIPDCDEVFNYWEPTHYLSNGNGLQTWEYSPVYAIRSWLYVGLHSLAILPASAFLNKTQQFFLLRYILGAVFATSQADLSHALSTVVSPDLGLIYILVSAPSAGMYQASAAYLPSSFALYFVTLGIGAFLKSEESPAKALVFFSIATLLGWPFALALAAPQVSFWVLAMYKRHGGPSMASLIIRSIFQPLLVLALVVLVDSVAYRKLVLVPLNIVLYNVFGGEGRGPDLYGTEPWWYYFANLSLNFNITLVLALTSCLVLIIAWAVWPNKIQGNQVTIIAPFYLWLAIFSLQPHKEERFMFPAYSALCINAATTLYWGGRIISHLSNTKLIGNLLVYATITGASLISISRVIAITTAYKAPMEIYQIGDQNLTGNVCFGKEWYRFPSSFFIPNTARPKFIKSAFAGLLPGHFVENPDDFRPGTWKIPENMNDLNQEDFSKYISISECSFLVDSRFDGKQTLELEPDYISDSANWTPVACATFLDAARTPFLNRALWIPHWIIKDKRVWADYCILERKDA